MKYMRRTAGYIWTDYKTNAQITKELKITPILDNLLEYYRSWTHHVNRMSRNRLPRVMKHYCPTGRRNYGRPLKRLLDTWDRNGSTSGPTPWQIYDDDDADDDLILSFVRRPDDGQLIEPYRQVKHKIKYIYVFYWNQKIFCCLFVVCCLITIFHISLRFRNLDAVRKKV